jgi:hypothetical protein
MADFLGRIQADPVLCMPIFIVSQEPYLVALAIMIPGKWIKCSQLHPPPAELFRGVQCKATYVCTHLEENTDSSAFVPHFHHSPLFSTRDLPTDFVQKLLTGKANEVWSEFAYIL